MLTKEEARMIIMAELERLPKYCNPSDPADHLIIVDEHTIEMAWGWVFFYTSDHYHRTGDFQYALVGNAPYFVNRQTGEVRVTGTAHPVQYYIAEYEHELSVRVQNK